MKNNRAALTVFKASAGSGKTFRLAVEYLKQLILNPKAYESILAVTFTNKATEEMKMRILSQLYGLSRRLPSSDNYMKRICAELSERQQEEITPEFVSHQASEALTYLLHNYSSFRVQTIDKFFQTILRNLTRELNLSPNIRVEIDAKNAEHDAVDHLIDNLKPNDDVLRWILEYVNANLDSDSNWNVIQSVKKFGEELIKDDYNEYADEFAELFEKKTGFFNNFTSSLLAMRGAMQKAVNERGKDILQALNAHGYSTDNLSSYMGKYIAKLPMSTIAECAPGATAINGAEDDENYMKKWVTSKAPAALKQLVDDELRPLLRTFLKEYDNCSKIDGSISTTLKHLSELRLLGAIRKQIEDENKENSRFLLSDTQSLLAKMIDDSDSPFIYERIGSRLHQIMIDEFQDTSRIQWQNFRVLLNDCMSHGHDNLIVGDVKQSIYRWRSGDWRLLNNIKNEFVQKIDEKTLSYNFRSSSRVIEFNNTFFRNSSRETYFTESQNLSKCETNSLRKAYRYSDLMQFVPENHEESGFVKVTVLPDDENYVDQQVRHTIDIIKELKDKGAKDSDIAIIVRKNNLIKIIAPELIKEIPGITIVSDDGFDLQSSVAVKIMMNALQLLLTPDDKIVKFMLVRDYQTAVLRSEDSITTLLLSDLDKLLPKEFLATREKLLMMPTYTLFTHLFRIFNLKSLTEESSYVATFFDNISEYIVNNSSDIQSVLDFWNTSLLKKKIESDRPDGLRMLTIHKSKGLEFTNVICPFVDWEYSRNDELFWCTTDEEPFNNLPAIPLDYTKALSNSVYSNDYFNEHLQKSVDQLNLLYVAFTRASQNLFVITKGDKPEKSDAKKDAKSTADTSSYNHVNKLVCKCITTMSEQKEISYVHDEDEKEYLKYEKPLPIVADNLEDGTKHYTYGVLDLVSGEEEDVKKDNVFEANPENYKVEDLELNYRSQEFRQSNASKEFTVDDEQEAATMEYIQLGNVLHSLMSRIYNEKDVEGAISEMVRDGVIANTGKVNALIRKCIARCFANNRVKDWYSDRWTVYNECNIVEYDKQEKKVVQHRPDRVIINDTETVVIDFKLRNDNTDYHSQVRRYMGVLRSMGHTNVRGYLLLLIPGKIVEVNENEEDC